MNCPICNKEFNINGIGRHFKTQHNILYSEYAKLNGLKKISVPKQKKEIIYDENSKNICEYGCQEIGKFKLKNSKWCCSKSINSCKGMRIKNGIGVSKALTGTSYKEGRESYFKNVPPWNKGLNKNIDERVKKQGETYRLRVKNGEIKTNKGLKMSNEFKEKMRQIMLNKYANGFEVKCGRAPKYDYESPIAGKIKVDGSWELKVAQYLDNLNIKWIRNKERFEYTNELNKMSTYCPDFYVYDWDCYIEVKGYKTKKDELKWKQFTKKLQVWNKKKLKELKIL